jgi:RNA polymerase II C-terminal domain phosphatase-like 3/4
LPLTRPFCPLWRSYIDVGLEVSAAEALRLRADEQRRVLSARKLFLVLDLDHTLLNSARAVDLDAASLAALHTATHSEAARAGGPQLYELRYLRLWTKLRPGARALLAAAAPLCEVLIYTMGDRGYAVEMARLLDPEGSLLRPGRLIAAQDCTQSGLKDLDVVLGSAEAVLILDDTPGVWRRHAANVIVAERYHYFPCSVRGHGGEGGAAWLPRGEDESEEDGTMAALLRLIRRVHAAFFDDTGAGGSADAPPQDVRPLLGAMRAAVLHGCVIVFSHGAALLCFASLWLVHAR